MLQLSAEVSCPYHANSIPILLCFEWLNEGNLTRKLMETGSVMYKDYCEILHAINIANLYPEVTENCNTL